MRRLAAAALVACTVLLLGGAVKGDAAREREITRETEASLDESDRFIDMSVTLIVVRKDPEGRSLIAGLPLMTEVRRHSLGGMLDTWGEGNDGRPCISGPGRRPAIWHCSEAMEPLILHGDDIPPWILCTGGEGASKTTSLAMWTYCRALEHVGYSDRQVGVIAPTDKRMGRVLEAIHKLWRPEWMVGGRLKPTDRDGLLTFRAGPSVMFVSAHQQSKAEGSRLQGFNFVAGAADEIQDCFDEWPNLYSRLRSAVEGIDAKVFASCTAKDDTAWRNFKEACSVMAEWLIVRVPGIDSPFVKDIHWTRMRNGAVTFREWQRRALAMDVGPEAAVYHCFERTLADGTPGNVRPIPLGAVDVTAQVLAGNQPVGDPRRIGMLCGHDPGKRQHVTEFLRAYQCPDDMRRGDSRPRWFVVDEVTSTQATIHDHAQAVRDRLREKWRCNTLDRKGQPDPDSPQVLVRIDPHTRAEKSDHPGPDVKTIWKAFGMLCKEAAYKPGAFTPATIPILSRINMMNTLFAATSTSGPPVRRLFIACDDKGKISAICDGKPCDSKFLAACESMEKNAAGECEAERKDKNDLSHWPCAVGYALWMPEHARAGQVAA